jgi:RHS repeat-associated protein
MSKTVGANPAAQETWDLAESMPLLVQDGTTKYITGPGGLPIEQVDGSRNVLYYVQNQLGSTRGLLDGSGTIAGSFTYDPYGNLKGSSGTATTPFQFAGEYTHAESGLQYLRARYSDPSVDESVTVDPLDGVTRIPYAYAGNGPTNGFDPSGLCKAGPVNVPFLGSSHNCSDDIGAGVYNVGSMVANAETKPTYAPGNGDLPSMVQHVADHIGSQADNTILAVHRATRSYSVGER